MTWRVAPVGLTSGFVGIKEGEENSRLTEFVSWLIPRLLGQDNFNRPFKTDMAHRRPKPLANERPWIIIARVHNDSNLVSIPQISH